MAAPLARSSYKVIYASAARTASTTPIVVDTRYYSGLIAYVDVTAIAATPSVVLNIDGYDALADEAYTLLDSAAIVAVSFNVYNIWAGAAVTANVSANRRLPDKARLEVIHGDADSITYAVTIVLLP
jgi:hypothetical protein